MEAQNAPRAVRGRVEAVVAFLEEPKCHDPVSRETAQLTESALFHVEQVLYAGRSLRTGTIELLDIAAR